MRTPTLASLLLISLLTAGCVTEGIEPIEPASDEEASQANLALGVGYIADGRPDIAIDVLQRALELDSRSADAHGAIALAYDQTGEFELAEEHHRRATQLGQANPGLNNSFAVFLCRQDRWDDAETYFERAIDRAGPNAPPSVMINAGTCARAADDLEASETYFRSALALEPANPDALRGMLDVSIRAGNFRNGRAFWQRIERSVPVIAEDLLSCYVIEQQLSDDRAATACADRLRNEFPGTPAATQLDQLERDAG